MDFIPKSEELQKLFSVFLNRVTWIGHHPSQRNCLPQGENHSPIIRIYFHSSLPVLKILYIGFQLIVPIDAIPCSINLFCSLLFLLFAGIDPTRNISNGGDTSTDCGSSFQLQCFFFFTFAEIFLKTIKFLSKVFPSKHIGPNIDLSPIVLDCLLYAFLKSP